MTAGLGETAGGPVTTSVRLAERVRQCAVQQESGQAKTASVTGTACLQTHRSAQSQPEPRPAGRMMQAFLCVCE